MSNYPRPLSESFSLMSPRMQQQTAADNNLAKPNSDLAQPGNANDGKGMRFNDKSPSSTHMSQKKNTSPRLPRPMTEFLNRRSVETEALDKWFEELQLYEKNLEDMANASFDPNFKEELGHVDQWYRALTEAERTAAVYSLLQHSSQVQLRFFATLLQQMSAQDQLGAMLSPAHPEKGKSSCRHLPYSYFLPFGDLQAQMVGAMAKAEKEASQKLLSVLPYQTGQVARRPPESLQGPRRTLDRHSFAIGDTEEYKGLFPVGSDFLSQHPSTFGNTSASLLDDQSLLSRAHLKPNDKTAQTESPLFGPRPRSVVESGDLSSSVLGNEWPQQTNRRTANNVGHIGDRSMNGRPRSADVANWYNSDIPPPIGDKGLGSAGDRSRPFSSTSPWNLTPSVSSFTERDANVDHANSVSDVDLQNALASWSLANNLGYPRANAMMNDDSKGYRRRPMARGGGIPRTVPESEEQGNFYSKFGEHERGSEPTSGGSTLTGSASQSRSVSRSASPAPSASNSSSHFGNASFGMWSGKHLSVPGLDKQIQQPQPQPQPQHTYGQFLNPSDAHVDGADLDYVSDHSDTSVISSNGTRRRRTSATGNSRAVKDKKAAEVVDMELLQDVPAWFRSLRLHKYNTVFETMKWQDIIKLSDEDLVTKGVAALGARRKMLKVFENVRAHCDANNIEY